MNERIGSAPLARSLKALEVVVALLVLLVVGGAIAAARQHDPVAVPPLVLQEAERQLAAMGEAIELSVPAFRRRWWDYFQPTRGVLAVSERRLLFIGIVPEPIAYALPDEPPALERATFAIDSAIVVPARTALRGSRGIEITLPDGASGFFIVHPRAWERAESLLVRVTSIQRQIELEVEAARLAREAAEAEARRALYHRVEHGETIISIAASYGLTADSLEMLNPGVDARRLWAGDSLLVRPQR